jgi:Cys-rich four helix bundle protein (predicted Tat secretion target)
MNRREMLLAGIALASTAMVNKAHAAANEHEDHHHVASANTGLVAAAANCVQKGQVCLNHCLTLLGEGDKDMAACSKSVSQMLVMCRALQQLANQESSYLPRLAAIARDACKQCEEECKKHADKHEACKACGESCATCLKECKKIAV